MTKKPGRVWAGLLCSAMLILTGCGGGARPEGAAAPAPAQPAAAKSPPAAAEKVRVGLSVANTFELLPAYIGVNEGLWKKRGLDVELTTFAGGAKLQQAILAKSIDVGLDAATGIALAVAKGSPSKIVAEIGRKVNLMVLVVPKNSPAKAAADLKGKKIGVTSHGAITDWLAKQLAKSQGWDPETGVTRVPLGGFQELMAGLKAGNVDGFVWSAEGALALEESGDGRILFSFGDQVPKYEFMMVQATDEMMTRRTETLQKFMAGWGEAVAFMKKNRDASVQQMVTAMKVSQQVAGRVYDLDIANVSADGVASREGLEAVAQSLVDLGNLQKKPAVESFYSEQFVPIKP